MIPPIPEVLDGHRTEALVPIRYEDVTQDGRLRPTSIPPALGILTWPTVMSHEDAEWARQEGVVPILSRMLIEIGAGPIPAIYPLKGRGAAHHASVRNASGEVERLMLMMWADLEGEEGWTHVRGTPGPVLQVARVYAEHVFTRLFGTGSDRRVRSLPRGVPADSWSFTRFETVAVPEAGATALDESHHPVAFSIAHTDANNHVNSMVYPRLLEDRAIDRLATFAENWGDLAARQVEVMWRKPFFIGERATIRLSLYPAKDGYRALGAFLDESGGERCRIAILLTA